MIKLIPIARYNIYQPTLLLLVFDFRLISKYICGKVMFPQASVWGGVTSNASWDRSHGTTPPRKGQVEYLSLDIKHRHPLLVTPGGDHWTPVQTCSFGPPGSDIWWWSMKLKHILFPGRRYTSYWNAFLLHNVEVGFALREVIDRKRGRQPRSPPPLKFQKTPWNWKLRIYQKIVSLGNYTKTSTSSHG